MMVIDNKPAPDVAQEPLTALVQWAIVKLDGQLLLLGRSAMTGKGRSSSPLQSFDPATMAGTTASGRRYTLLGDQAPQDVIHLLALACLRQIRGIEVVAPEDVGAELSGGPRPYQ